MTTQTQAVALPLERAYHFEETSPDRIYLVQPMGGGVVRELSWKVALDEARRMATYLKSLGYPEKSHIALFSKNTAYWILADLAIQMAGHISIPLYPILGPDTISYVLEHSEAKMVFVGKLDNYEAMAPGIPESMPRVALPLCPDLGDTPKWEDLIKQHEPIEGKPTRDPNEMATIVYTSGSTGRPKGVMINFHAMAVGAHGLGAYLNMSADDRMLSYLPLAHVMERWLVESCSLVFGMKIFFAESIDTFVNDLQRATPTLFLSVPRLWVKFRQGVLAKMPEKKLNLFLKIPILSGIVKKKILTKLGLQHVRFAGSGSAPLPPDVLQWYRNLGLELLEGYGMSENFAYSHVSRPGAARVGYVGHPYPEVQQRLSEEGEIQIKSPSNMMGYYKDEEKTKETFTEDGWLKTGDRGEIDSEGRLKITGRTKELFKTSKGKYVAPAPIENKILTHAHIEQCCVMGSGQPQPHAVLMMAETSAGVSKDELKASLEAHLKAVNAQLDHHEHMSFFAVIKDSWQIENGFLTPTMKMKRAKIEDTYGSLGDGWYAAKQTVIWQE